MSIRQTFSRVWQGGQRQEQGKQICEDAMARQFYIAETYVNLARLYLDRPIPPYRRKAKSLLESALKIDGTNRMALQELARVDSGRFRAISFLGFDNPINRLIAKLLGKR